MDERKVPGMEAGAESASEVAADVSVGGGSAATGTSDQSVDGVAEDLRTGDCIPLAGARSAARRSAATEETAASPALSGDDGASVPAQESSATDKKKPKPMPAHMLKPVFSGDFEPNPGESSGAFQRQMRREATKRLHEEVEWRAENRQEPERPNPLLHLREKERDELFRWLRQVPYADTVKAKLAEDGIPDVTDAELKEFHDAQSDNHWHTHLARAATEADSLVSYIESYEVKYSKGILGALGQEAFRQIAAGQATSEAVGRLTTLFLKARADERSEQLLELRREKMNFERRTQTEEALEAFAVEIEKHPDAQEAFDALRRELLYVEEEAE